MLILRKHQFIKYFNTDITVIHYIIYIVLYQDVFRKLSHISIFSIIFFYFAIYGIQHKYM